MRLVSHTAANGCGFDLAPWATLAASLLVGACSTADVSPPVLSRDAQPVDGGTADAGVPDSRAELQDAEALELGVADGSQLDAATADGSVSVADAGSISDCEDPGCWRSTLYPADWAPGFTDPDGRFLHDFSYAGYGAGERSIPTSSSAVFDVTSFGTGPDWRPAIQGAIDAAAASGGGVVHLPAGMYRVDGVLQIQASGIVLRGDGAAATRVYFSSVLGMTDRAHVEVGADPEYGAPVPIIEDAANRDRWLVVEDASSLSVGDCVAVGWVITDAFRADHGMSEYWGFAAGAWRAFFRRTVRAVDTQSPGAHRIELDVPLRYAALVRDGASIRPIEGAFTEIGIEDLAVSNAVDRTLARAEDRVSLIAFRGVEDGWIRRVQTFVSPLSAPANGGFQVQSHGISVINSRRVTVEDVSIGRAQNRGSGGNGYLIEVSRSNEVLVQRAVLREGRHNFCFNWDFGTSGVVIRDSDSEGSDCENTLGTCRNEFHHSLAMAILIENSRIADGWVGGNRRSESSGAGHTATESVYWRLYGGPQIYSWQYGHGYLVGNDITEQFVEVADTSQSGWALEWLPFWALSSNGHTSLDTEPEDWLEGAGARETLVPASLYLDQLERRRRRSPP